MAFAQPGVWDGPTGGDRSVVAEEVRWSLDVDSKVFQSRPEACDLLDSHPCCGELRPARGCLDGGLFLREPLDWCLIDKMQYTGYCSSRRQVMVEVSVLISRRDDWLALGRRRVFRSFLPNLPIDRAFPIIFLVG